MPASRRRLVLGLFAAIAGPCVAAWLAVNVLKELPSVLFIAAIVVAVSLGRMVAGAVAVVLSAILLDYYTFAPIHLFGSTSAQELVTLAIFVVLAIAGSQLFVLRGRQLARARLTSLRLQLALDAALMGTWEWDVKTGEVIWDPRLEQIYGLPPGTFDGTYETYLSLIHPDDVADLTTAVDQGVRSKTGHHHTHRVVHPAGEIRWVDGAGTAILDDDGDVVGMIGVTLDVTDQRRAEEIARSVQSVADAALSTLGFDALAEAVLERVRAALGADAACVLLATPDGQFLEEAAFVGARDPQPGERFPAQRGVSGAVMSRRGPVVIDDLSTAEVERAWLKEMRSFAGVPLERSGRTMGVLHVTTRHPHRFDDDDTKLLSLAGGRVASALERARLYEEERRASFRVRLLAQVGEALASSNDYEATVEHVARIAVPDLADWCSVEVLDTHGDLKPLAVVHVEPEKEALARRLRAESPYDPHASTGPPAVIRTGLPELRKTITPDEIEISKRSHPELADLIGSLGSRSTMVVPLSSPGEGVFGVMTFVMSGSGRTFDESDLSLATELARRSALAISNARLFRERDRIAETFELSLRPPEMPAIPGVSVAGAFVPAGVHGTVAGDFYDVFPGVGDDWLAVIGDVCGKGPEAAAVMALSRYTVRTAALTSSAPTHILDTLNNALLRYGADRFCTVAVARFRSRDGEVAVEVATGGHPPPLVVRKMGSIEEVSSEGTLVGVFQDAAFSAARVRLGAGDLLLMYTDGVTEARGDKGFFGEERLHQRACVHAGSSAQQMAGNLLEDVEAFGLGAPDDDIAILALGPG